MKNLFFLLLCISVLGCKENTSNKEAVTSTDVSKEVPLKYAKGFSITNHKNYKTLKITNPWPNANKTYSFALVPKELYSQIKLNKNEFDGVITTPLKNVITTSTTHLPAIELLDEVNSIIGFPGTDYISSEAFRKRVDNKHIKDVGANEKLNTELILELQPEAFITFGINGVVKSLNTLKHANIPVLYNGNWVEESPLAKAEWVKFFGVLYGKEAKADSIFKSIESNYLKVKDLAKNSKHRPTVLSGAMHKDVWHLPNATSSEGQILKDANVAYLWKNSNERGSLALSFETVFEKAKTAEFWISPGHYKTYKGLKKANSHYTEFDAFKNKNIYAFTNTVGPTGGTIYYELGITRPDIILQDIIKICHPEVLPDYEPFFFKPLK